MSEIPRRRPRVGISACLRGESVRYDGGHKRSAFVMERLGAHVDFVPLCPEVEAGLPVPREPMRLVGEPGRLRVVGSRTGTDFTPRLEAHARAKVAHLASLALDGMVLKKDSPTCGIERVRAFPEGAGRDVPPRRDGSGVFAAAVRATLPDVPLTEEGWLSDDRLRERFLSSVFTRHRLRVALAEPSARRLVSVHAAHKLLFMAHDPAGQTRLGRTVASAGVTDARTLASRYVGEAVAVLARPPSRGKHANVLEHALGFLKRRIVARERQALHAAIDAYRTGVHELAVPIALFEHHLGRLELGGWLAAQVYFAPYPREIAPRA